MSTSSPCQYSRPAVRHSLVFVALFVALQQFTSLPAGAQSVQRIAATVNDQAISSYDLEQRMRLALSARRTQPDTQAIKQIQNQVMDQMINETLQIQESKRLGIKISDADIDRGLGQIAKQNKITTEQLLGQIQNAGVEKEVLREQVQAELAWSQLIRLRFGSQVTVGQDEIDAVYDRIQKSETDASYRVGEIFIPVNESVTDQQATNAMQQIVQRLRSGDNFREIARDFARQTGSVRSGDIGWVVPGQLDPDIDDLLAKMSEGAIEGPIRTAEGYSMIALISKRQSAPASGGSGELVTLKQLVIEVEQNTSTENFAKARAQANIAAAGLNNCGDMDKVKDNYSDKSGDLGTVSLASLSPAFRNSIATLPNNKATSPIRTDDGLYILMVCDRSDGGRETEAKARIEAGMLQQQLGMRARQYLRDLRRDATVDLRR